LKFRNGAAVGDDLAGQSVRVGQRVEINFRSVRQLPKAGLLDSLAHGAKPAEKSECASSFTRGAKTFNSVAQTNTMNTVTSLKVVKNKVAPMVESALAESGGLLRLAPCWVPRSFLQPGNRLKLHPDDLYAFGLNRGESTSAGSVQPPPPPMTTARRTKA